MRFSPIQDAAEERLLEQMRQLHDRLDDKQIHSAEYKRISAEILDLSKAYGKLTDARQGITRTGRKDVMPISIVSDDTRPLVTAVATGTVTFAELADFVRNEQTGDRWHAPVLLDASAANTSMSGADAERLADEIATATTHVSPRGPVAIIAVDEIPFAVLRICQMFCEQRHIMFRVCRRYQTAERWLVQAVDQPDDDTAPAVIH